MSFYMLQIAYTPESFKAMIANPSDRRAAADTVAEAVGAKVRDFYFAFGKYDAVVIIEAPDDVAAAGAAMAVAASGGFSGGETTKLLTSEEAVAAMKMGAKVAAAGYRPPTA
jgi:uncharacterized protein with GYD domain